jgi:hypothetical protein
MGSCDARHRHQTSLARGPVGNSPEGLGLLRLVISSIFLVVLHFGLERGNAGGHTISFRRSQISVCQQEVPLNDALIVPAKEGRGCAFRPVRKFGRHFPALLGTQWVPHKTLPTFAARKTTWRNYRIKWLDRRDGFPSLGVTSITAI